MKKRRTSKKMRRCMPMLLAILFVVLIGCGSDGGNNTDSGLVETETDTSNPGTDAEAETGTDSGSSETDTGPVAPPSGESFSNTLGMTFNLIAGGTFMMGSPETELGREQEEIPHRVTLTQDYYIQTTEVTQRQWMAVMGSNNNPSRFTACGPDCPVESVSFEDIGNFIMRLNGLGLGTYRLPYEAEWEYAARGGQVTAFSNGDISETECFPLDPVLNNVGWFCGNVQVGYDNPYDDSANGGPVRGGTNPVGSLQPNPYGLYDMHGNVWEWCQDWYGPYPAQDVSDPTGAEASSSVYRVIRGGGWRNEAWRCRSAHRGQNFPDQYSPSGGFRLVCTRVPG